MSKELKPCPFCGGEAYINTEYDTDGFGNFHEVKCKKCGARSGARFVSTGNECPQNYLEVRSDWDTRAESEEIISRNQRDRLIRLARQLEVTTGPKAVRHLIIRLKYLADEMVNQDE